MNAPVEVLIDNRDGQLLELPVERFAWKTERKGAAGELNIDFLLKPGTTATVKEGAVIRVKVGQAKVFYGFVFRVSGNLTSKISVKAFDQLRYLKNKDTFVLKEMKASEAITIIAKRMGCNIGSIEDTVHLQPARVEDETEAFDIILDYISISLTTQMRDYILYDDFGKLTLRGMNKMAIPITEFYIGDESLLTEAEWERSIEDAVNRVKLVQDNKETGKREVYISQDSGNIAKWGLLQEFQKVDEKMKPPEIKETAEAIMRVKNRVSQTLKLSALGYWGVRAGRLTPVYIEQLGFKHHLMVESCTHTWERGVHKMDLEMKVFNI